MKSHIRLTLSQKYELADHLRAISSEKLSKRLLAISLRHYGYNIVDIARIQGVNERTVRNWIQEFKKGGFEQLLQLNYEGRRHSRLQPYLADIARWKQQNPDATLESLQAYLKERHKLEIEYSWLYRFLKKRKLW